MLPSVNRIFYSVPLRLYVSAANDQPSSDLIFQLKHIALFLLDMMCLLTATPISVSQRRGDVPPQCHYEVIISPSFSAQLECLLVLLVTLVITVKQLNSATYSRDKACTFLFQIDGTPNLLGYGHEQTHKRNPVFMKVIKFLNSRFHFVRNRRQSTYLVYKSSTSGSVQFFPFRANLKSCSGSCHSTINICL